MKSSESHPASVEAPPAGEDETTGLPGFRTWRKVYILVLASFVLWVVLLLVLTMSYS
jgi:hypothetical protein